jgi:hypothetical protein
MELPVSDQQLNILKRLPSDIDISYLNMNSVIEYAEKLPKRIKQTGRTGEAPVETLLKAGKLDMIYCNGSLRYISAGSIELIRMIYAAVRDRDWLTITPSIENEKIEVQGNSFVIKIRCLYQSETVKFSAEYIIEGKQDNSVTVSMEGRALEKSEKNRIGFCILHPIEGYSGRKCNIVHTDGSTEQSAFPEEISKYQVFTDIRSMTWLADETKCRIDFEGDIFETEDQRNWTDASFKTYSTPLSLPFPANIEKDTRIYQKVVFRVDGYIDTTPCATEKTVIKLLHKETFRIPSVGICQSTRSIPMNKNEIKVLRAIRFDHYRVDLHLYGKEWKSKAEKAVSESSDLGYPIEFALFFDDNSIQQITSFTKWYARRKLSVSSILIFHRSYPSTPDNLARQVIPFLREVDPEVKTVTGTNANFAQINRNRPGDTGNDLICFSIQPQEHGSDNPTLVENLKAQEYTVLSAKRFARNKEIIISPVTIQRRLNANNTFVELPWIGSDIPPQVDSRQISLFGGCWTTGSLKYLCDSGADSVTYFETTGERGIIQGDKDSQWPLHFPSMKGMIFPVYHVLKFLLSNKSLNMIKSTSSRPLLIDCLAMTDGKQVRVLLVNFTGTSQSLKFECCSGMFRVRTLNTDNYGEAASNPQWNGIENEKVIRSDSIFELDPFSINFIEGWRKH